MPREETLGIRGKMQTLERAVYTKRREGGLKEWPGVNIILAGARIGASWANWYESIVKCGGLLGADAFCIKDLDAKFDRYTRSEKPAEHKQLAEEIQRAMLENYYYVPVFRHAFMNAIGPRIVATKWQDVYPSFISTGYAYPGKKSDSKHDAGRVHPRGGGEDAATIGDTAHRAAGRGVGDDDADRSACAPCPGGDAGRTERQDDARLAHQHRAALARPAAA